MIRIVGDISLGDGYFDRGFGVGSYIEDGINPLKLISESNDVWLGNFEGVCADSSDKTGLKSEQFRTPLSSIAKLSHPNIYSVANNHSMQHGHDAFEQTVSNLSSLGCKVVGTLTNKSVSFDYNQYKIAVTSFSVREETFAKPSSYWFDPSKEEISEEYLKLAECDFKILYIHWGDEFINYPSANQIRFARWAIELGFDIIIGLHPHIIQGFEIFKGKHIFYSIGNFVFNMPWLPLRYGAIVNIDLINGKPEIGYSYFKIGNDYTPRIVTSIPEEYSFEYLNGFINENQTDERYCKDLKKAMRKYQTINRATIIRNIPKFSASDLYSIFNDFIQRKWTHK